MILKITGVFSPIKVVHVVPSYSEVHKMGLGNEIKKQRERKKNKE
jgi:hypothetical protein